MYLILLLVGAFILFITAIKIAVWYEKVHRLSLIHISEPTRH